jgi:DNA-binding NarL/FixJ family response regulator
MGNSAYIVTDHPLAALLIEQCLHWNVIRTVISSSQILNIELPLCHRPHLVMIIVDELSIRDSHFPILRSLTRQIPNAKTVIVGSSGLTNIKQSSYVANGVWTYISCTEGSSSLRKAIMSLSNGHFGTPDEAFDSHISRMLLPDQIDLPGLHLTKRENEIVRLVCAGYCNKDISRSISVSESTVRFHIGNLFVKFGVHSRGLLAATYNQLLLEK